jgi:hypothetical protein
MGAAAQMRPSRTSVAGTLLLAVVVLAPPSVEAGHESPFYPSFYPQEIRIETLEPANVAAGWPKARVHAYVGEGVFSGSPVPADAIAVESLGSYLVLTFDASDGRYAAASSAPKSRCAAAGRILRALTPAGADFVPHPYPVTPYHADYLDQFDLARRIQAQYRAPVDDAAAGVNLRIRARGPLAEGLVPDNWKADASGWDATLEEIDIDQLASPSSAWLGGWIEPPWIKQGWFQAQRLYAGHSGRGSARVQADAAYRRLVTGSYRTPTERINLERTLVSGLVAGCERVVLGYRLRREYFNAEYSSGVENVAFDSQAGFLSQIFPRTVKLKDFPWNGWLRLGVAAAPTAAWNPVGGLDDPFGRLLWQAVGDTALLPEPYGAGWVANRASATAAAMSPGATIPEDALRPEPGTGLLRRVGRGKTAQQRVRYSVVTSAFHDGTPTTVADILYPYIFASRWGAGPRRDGASFDPVVARSTALLRDWLAGFKVIGVTTQTRDYGSDLQFTYRVPVVDVYLHHRSTDPSEAAAVAPPWSTLPWNVIVLMEEAVKRGFAAFSESEAQRLGVPWLDLVRDRATGAQLAALVDEFRQQGYRPAALNELVTEEEARERWTALGAFHAQHGHFLVTNGPYQLDSWSADGVVLQVFRDLSYPQGVGTFDEYAIPVRAYVSGMEDRGDRIEIAAEVERASKFQRSYEIERVALGLESDGAANNDRPECRYVIIAPGGNVARVGMAAFAKDGRFVVGLKDLLRPGLYTVAIAFFVGGNKVNPEIKVLEHLVAATSAARPSRGAHAALSR